MPRRLKTKYGLRSDGVVHAVTLLTLASQHERKDAFEEKAGICMPRSLFRMCFMPPY